MVIDFHTHVFPDKIAEKTISQLMIAGNIQSYGNGTLKNLKEAMKRSGTDYALVLPVCTKPSQFDSINRFAADINGHDGIFSFGGIHPDNDNVKERLKFLKESGFKGIKLHPDYQQCYICDERYYRIVSEAINLDLYVTIHAGVDVAFPNDVHCPPAESRKLIDRIYGNSKDVEPRIILAHLGGIDQYDDAEKYLVGQPVMLDLAVILSMAPKKQIERIIRSQGADRVLFASDYPWSDLRSNLEIMRSLDLTEEEFELITHKNAEKILNIQNHI